MPRTGNARDAESLEDALEEPVGGKDGRQGQRGSAIRMGEGELIEGPSDVAFVLAVPGYRRADIGVYPEQGRLRVEAFDFKIVRHLRTPVDPSTARSTYVDGVLSVRLAKLF